MPAAGHPFAIFDHLNVFCRQGIGGHHGSARVRRLEDAHLLESLLHRRGDFPHLALIDLGGGKKNHEEGEQEGDEVRIGDQPTFVVHVLGGFFLSAHEEDSRDSSGGGASAKKALQLGLDHAGIQAFQDGDHAFQHHLPHLVLGPNADLELAGGGQEEQVGGAHAVNRGDEGHGDAAAHFVNVVQVLHHLDEAQDRPDNANRGRESAGRLEHLGNALFVLGLIIQFKLHHLAQFLGFGAVHRQHQRLAKEGLLDVFEFAVERHNAFLAGLMGKADDFFNQFLRVCLRIKKDVAQSLDSLPARRGGETAT